MRLSRFRRWGLIVAGLAVSGAAVVAMAAPPRGGHGRGEGHRVMAQLSEQERAQLKDLRARLDSGALSPKDFAAQVDTLLGDRRAEGMHGYRGAIAERIKGIMPRLAAKLELTEQQRSLAKEEFTAARHQARLIAIEGMAKARLALTPEQRAKFDELRQERFESVRKGDGVRAAVGRVKEQLGLGAEQQSVIKALREQTRNDLRAVREGTKAKFEQILTPEQVEQLKQMREKMKERAKERIGGHAGA